MTLFDYGMLNAQLVECEYQRNEIRLSDISDMTLAFMSHLDLTWRHAFMRRRSMKDENKRRSLYGMIPSIY